MSKVKKELYTDEFSKVPELLKNNISCYNVRGRSQTTIKEEVGK